MNKPMNTKERTQQRRIWLLSKMEEFKLLVDLYGTKTTVGWKPKKDHPLRKWIEDNQVEAGYSATLSWKVVWYTLHHDYETIQKGWKPINQHS